MFKVIAIIIVFGVLVFFHELGHLLLAKRAGILCREFAIGMGPKLFSFKKAETTYTLRLLPIGGFVRMAGEDPEVVAINPGQEVAIIVENDKVTKVIVNELQSHPQAEVVTVESIDLEHALELTAVQDSELRKWDIDPKADLINNGQAFQIAPWNRQFAGKTIRQRAATIFAGPAANFILAFVLLLIMALAYGSPVDKPILGAIGEEGPAEAAGLQEGDRILSIDGQGMQTWEDVVNKVSRMPGEELELVIERNQEQMKVLMVTDNMENVGKIGVYQPLSKEPALSVKYAGEATWEFSTMLFKGLGMLVSGKVSMDELSGPVGIFNYTYEAAERGVGMLLQWAAVLSINLGIVNLLPLPALDGGRLVFILIEGLRGKPIDPQKEGMVHFLGFALLMLLILVITWNDIQRIFF